MVDCEGVDEERLMRWGVVGGAVGKVLGLLCGVGVWERLLEDCMG